MVSSHAKNKRSKSNNSEHSDEYDNHDSMKQNFEKQFKANMLRDDQAFKNSKDYEKSSLLTQASARSTSPRPGSCCTTSTASPTATSTSSAASPPGS